MALLTSLLSIKLATVAAVPVASDATTVCDKSGWYHGYQGVGVQYKVGDTNPDGIIAIGGSVPSGCSIL